MLIVTLVALFLGAGLPPAPLDDGVISTPDRAVELGEVRWRRDFDLALDLARSESKPVLLLFQEVPGCQTCINFGAKVLSHPLVVEAAEDLFVPVVVYNNKSGEDGEMLARFGEPAWNNPVLRFIDASGKDLIKREDGIYALGPTVNRMIAALQAAGRSVPLYLDLLSQENRVGLTPATFAMTCFWVGEARLGSLDGVVNTRPGWVDGLEVIDLTYDPGRIGYGELVETALTMDCANRIFTHSDEQATVGSRIAGELVSSYPGKIQPAAPADHFYRLKRTPWLQLDLTDAQKTKINAAIGLRKGNPESFLSPRQKQRLDELRDR